MVWQAALFLTVAAVDRPMESYVWPLAHARRCPRITVDAKNAPELAPWGEQANRICTEWWPHITQLLSTQTLKVPKTIRFVFRNKQDAPAYCAGAEISISADWVRAHPDDFGMMIHELTHVVQSYPDNKVDTGFLVEGIADWVRWWRYEPEAGRNKVDFSKAKLRDGYGTTAAWMGYVSMRYDRRFIASIDAALRAGTDPNPVIKRMTGHTADELWDEFKAARG